MTISVERLKKQYNHQVILDGVSFSAEKGDVLALMGNSGSGKSTLLRCLNLLTIPDSGAIQVDEAKMVFVPNQPSPVTTDQLLALRKKMGMVFQQFNLWSHMTVLQNLIEAPLSVLKQDRAKTIEEANRLLDKVGLSDKALAYPSQLSGGQQQRVAIARSLMMKPEIMLFDEPTSALDPEMVGEVLTVMRQLANEGMTMIVVTHEMKFARQVATHGIYLDKGKIVEAGEIKELFSNPRSERLKRFLEIFS